jgi:hypothetical protein
MSAAAGISAGNGDGNASPPAGRDPRPGRPRLFARRPAGRPETLPGQAAETPAAETPVSASDDAHLNLPRPAL